VKTVVIVHRRRRRGDTCPPPPPFIRYLGKFENIRANWIWRPFF